MEKTIYSAANRVLLQWLRSCRKRKRLTMRALAEKLDLPHSWVGKIEQGERRLDVVEYVRLSLALGVDPREGIRKIEEMIEREEAERLRSGGKIPQELR